MKFKPKWLLISLAILWITFAQLVYADIDSTGPNYVRYPVGSQICNSVVVHALNGQDPQGPNHFHRLCFHDEAAQLDCSYNEYLDNESLQMRSYGFWLLGNQVYTDPVMCYYKITDPDYKACSVAHEYYTDTFSVVDCLNENIQTNEGFNTANISSSTISKTEVMNLTDYLVTIFVSVFLILLMFVIFFFLAQIFLRKK